MALCVLASNPASAQAPFPIPVPAAVAVVPLLVLTVPLVMLVRRGDEARVHELQARHDWQGLVSLADRHLADRPGDASWLLLRGQALQMSQGCVAALPDLAAGFDAVRAAVSGAASASSAAASTAASTAPAQAPEVALAAGLALGSCQLLDARWADAEVTMKGLETLAPARWEPLYQLAWLQLRRGDAAAAQAMLARLRTLQPGLADTLQAWPPRAAASWHPSSPSSPWSSDPSTSAASAAPSASVVDAGPGARSVNLGRRSLVLPPGAWTLWREPPVVVRAGGVVGPTGTDVQVPLARHHARLDTAGGPAWLQLAGNEAEAHGVVRWRVDARCDAPGALLVERYGRRVDRPECLLVRVHAGPMGAADEASTAPAPGPSEGPWYEIDYRRYGWGWAVQASWWMPADLLPGPLAAAQWARMWAEALRPLADGRSAGALPPLPR